MKNFLKNNYILILILLAGLILRIYNVKELFMYGHDQDLEGWFIKDILVNKHLRLIGQETSTHGIFIGPLFYYLLIPFYMIFGMDPIGGTYLVLLLGLFAIFSFYFVFTKIFSKHIGLIAALIYSVSFYTVANDREVVPTMPVILWTVWFLFSLNLILKGKQKMGFILMGVLIGLIWHLNMALILLIPLVLAAFYLSKKKIDARALVEGVGVSLITLFPLIAFEIRHNYSQIRSLFISLTTDQRDILTGFEKVKRVIYLASKDLNGLVWGSFVDIKYEYLLLVLILVGIYLFFKKSVWKNMILILLLWFLSYIVFFSFYSKIVSEYYLNGLITFYIAILSIGISLFKINKGKEIVFSILGLFALINLTRFFEQPINKSGYLERIGIITEIKKDSAQKGYPCVSISYITDPGYDLGYRYFIWLQKLKTKKVTGDVPVYSIVFPQKPEFKTNVDVGAIGLIYPEYEKYNKEKVSTNCLGNDYNLENSMFGYTE